MRRWQLTWKCSVSLLAGILAAVPAVAAAPGNVDGLSFADREQLLWTAHEAADSYNVYRNALAGVAEMPARCWVYGLPDPELDVADVPAPGEGWFYLVSAESEIDGEGQLGADSSGQPRPRLGACRTVLRHSAMRRTGYGWSEWTDERIEALGLDGYLEEQLDPASISEVDNDALNDALTAWLPPQDIFGLIGQQVVRSVYSRRQLEQAATAFWTNHFNTYWVKSIQVFNNVFPACINPPSPACDPAFPSKSYRTATGLHYREVQQFRETAFTGNFRQILEQSARSPAMILFLDSYANVAGAPNENYARECLELYAMGVQGGYTQTDVEELARAFTGWTVCKKSIDDADDPLAPCLMNYWEDVPIGVWTSHFVPSRHDCNPKTLFAGTAYEITTPFTCINPTAGVDDLTLALDAIAAHPSTARFISMKILQRFVTDDPTPEMIDALVEVWNDPTNPEGVGDLREVLRVALTLPQFLAPDGVGGKIKTPLEHMASALRALRGSTDGVTRVLEFLVGAQQIPFYNEIPTGYPEDGGSWIGTNNTLERQNLGAHLALVANPAFGSDPLGLLADHGVPTAPGNADAIVDFFSDLLFGGALTPAERQAAIDFLNSDETGVPAPYNAARIRQVVGFLLGYPQFQEQ